MLEITQTLEEAKTVFATWLKKRYPPTYLQKARALLKPNIGYPKPSPYTTSLGIIKTVVEVLTKNNLKEVIIAEGSTSTSTAQENFRKVGLLRELKEYPNITFVDLNECKATAIKVRNTTHYLPTLLKEVELKLSLPVIKFYTDSQGKIFLSNAVKNFFGLPPKKPYQKDNHSYRRDSLHKDLHRSVVEIYQAVKTFAPFDFYFCDGLTILEGKEAKGTPFNWGKIILAENALEADLTVLKLLNKPLPKYLEELMKEENRTESSSPIYNYKQN